MSKDVVNMIANLEQMWWRPYLLTFVSTYGLYLVYPLVNVIFAAYLLICKDEQIHFFMQCKSNPKPKKVITKIKQKETKITKKRYKKRRNSRFELTIPLLIWFSTEPGHSSSKYSAKFNGLQNRMVSFVGFFFLIVLCGRWLVGAGKLPSC